MLVIQIKLYGRKRRFRMPCRTSMIFKGQLKSRENGCNGAETDYFRSQTCRTEPFRSAHFSFDMNRSRSTMKRMWVPSPISSPSCRASIRNVSLRPSIFSRRAVASISAPKGDGLRCEHEIIPPTVVLPSGNSAATVFIAAFSMRAVIAGVASTSRSPEPMLRAVRISATVRREVWESPSFNMRIDCRFELQR